MQLFVNNLINLDFSYLDSQRGLVGETWLASIELKGDLDAQGMIVDFGIVKAIAREWLEDIIDHRLLVPKQNTHLNVHEENTLQTTFTWNSKIGTFSHRSPAQAVTFITADAITPESVAAWCQQQLIQQFPDVLDLKLTLTSEKIDGPYYQYSHGLRKHKGNCQRIAHGHRSPIEVFIFGKLDQAIATEWAEQWQDIYIGTEDDISFEDEEMIEFSYTSQQGAFMLKMPKSHTYCLSTETTVENIAKHIAQKIGETQQLPSKAVTVKAYEGWGKGAIAEN